MYILLMLLSQYFVVVLIFKDQLHQLLNLKAPGYRQIDPVDPPILYMASYSGFHVVSVIIYKIK